MEREEMRHRLVDYLVPTIYKTGGDKFDIYAYLQKHCTS
jgi:hypothetical protein